MNNTCSQSPWCDEDKCKCSEWNTHQFMIDETELTTATSPSIFTKIVKFLKRNFYTICNTIIAIGLVVVILSPFIIDYFTKY